MDLDTSLKELGQFGKFQALYFILLMFPVILCGFRSTEYIFTTMDIPHRCRVPECEETAGETQYSPSWISHAVPFTKSQEPEPCLRYRPLHNSTGENASSCPADLFNHHVIDSCKAWVFTEPTKTIGHDFNIMCPEDVWKRTLLGSLSVITSFIGLPLTGFICDRVGRKTVLVYGSVLISVTGIIRSFSPNYTFLAVFEMFDGLITGSLYGPAFILGLETLSPNKRLLGSMLVNIFFALGEVALALTMWVVQNWRIMQRVFYTPMLAIVVLHWLLPESVRWLYTRGRFDDIEKIFRKIAKVNKTQNRLATVVSSLRSSQLDKDGACKRDVEEPIRTLRLRAVLKSRIIMWRLVICSLCWIATIFTYYGVSQNATYFGGNHYISFLMVSLVEMPAYVASLWLPDWELLGRRGSTAWSFFICGAACFGLIFVNSANQWPSLILFLVAKFCSTLTVTVIYLYTAEIFPTELRNSLLSICSMVGRLGSVLSQQTPLIGSYLHPMTLFAAVSMVGGVLALTCPETLNTKLPDTIQEAENISGLRSRKAAVVHPENK